MSNDFFAHKAAIYDQDNRRVSNVENIANAIVQHAPLAPRQHIMDFGSGTGLLLERIAPHVEKITAVDISASMNQQLEEKRAALPCQLDIQAVDLTKETMDNRFDGIISSMTLHHIDDIPSMLTTLHALLKPGGFLAIADLDTEDGSFHTEDTGVYHFGFDRDTLTQQALTAGFTQANTHDASIVEKPHGTYPVFLLTAVKAP